jgi:hypothetical protein
MNAGPAIIVLRKSRAFMMKLKLPARSARGKPGASFSLHRLYSGEAVSTLPIVAKTPEPRKAKAQRRAKQLKKLAEKRQAKEQIKLAERTVTYGLSPNDVGEAIKGAEELEDTLDKLPDDSFKKEMEEKYLPIKFQPNAVPELQTEILKEKNLWVDTPAFEKEVVPLLTRLQMFQKQYTDRTTIIEWDGTQAGIAQAIADFKKLLKEDKLKWYAFIARV